MLCKLLDRLNGLSFNSMLKIASSYADSQQKAGNLGVEYKVAGFGDRNILITDDIDISDFDIRQVKDYNKISFRHRNMLGYDTIVPFYYRIDEYVYINLRDNVDNILSVLLLNNVYEYIKGLRLSNGTMLGYNYRESSYMFDLIALFLNIFSQSIGIKPLSSIYDKINGVVSIEDSFIFYLVNKQLHSNIESDDKNECSRYILEDDGEFMLYLYKENFDANDFIKLINRLNSYCWKCLRSVELVLDKEVLKFLQKDVINFNQDFESESKKDFESYYRLKYPDADSLIKAIRCNEDCIFTYICKGLDLDTSNHKYVKNILVDILGKEVSGV